MIEIGAFLFEFCIGNQCKWESCATTARLLLSVACDDAKAALFQCARNAAQGALGATGGALPIKVTSGNYRGLRIFLADHHGTESMATPDIYYTLDPARKLLSGNLFEMLQAMSALPGKDWYFGGSKGFEGKKGPFGKTPEKLVRDLRESRIDPMGPERCRPQ